MNDEFGADQLVGSHGSAGVEFVGTDADFCAEAEFSAVGKTGGGIVIHRGGVHIGKHQICKEENQGNRD